MRLDWPLILVDAAEIVLSYDTAVTLRQLFYRLVAKGVLQNTSTAYKTLSARTAAARRNGGFPALADNTRKISQYRSFDGPDDAREWLARIYQRDRTEGQEYNIYLGVEKRTILAQLEAWFGDHGLPMLALGGYSSQSFEAEVIADAEVDGRPAVLLYAGDFDPSGEDIDRNFVEQVACFDRVVRVALTPEQVEEYQLPPQPGKPSDSRSEAFRERHGVLVQVELEALDPETLRELYADALEGFWDTSAFNSSLAAEKLDMLDIDPSR